MTDKKEDPACTWISQAEAGYTLFMLPGAARS